MSTITPFLADLNDYPDITTDEGLAHYMNECFQNPDDTLICQSPLFFQRCNEGFDHPWCNELNGKPTKLFDEENEFYLPGSSGWVGSDKTTKAQRGSNANERTVPSRTPGQRQQTSPRVQSAGLKTPTVVAIGAAGVLAAGIAAWYTFS